MRVHHGGVLIAAALAIDHQRALAYAGRVQRAHIRALPALMHNHAAVQVGDGLLQPCRQGQVGAHPGFARYAGQRVHGRAVHIIGGIVFRAVPKPAHIRLVRFHQRFQRARNRIVPGDFNGRGGLVRLAFRPYQRQHRAVPVGAQGEDGFLLRLPQRFARAQVILRNHILDAIGRVKHAQHGEHAVHGKHVYQGRHFLIAVLAKVQRGYVQRAQGRNGGRALRVHKARNGGPLILAIAVLQAVEAFPVAEQAVYNRRVLRVLLQAIVFKTGKHNLGGLHAGLPPLQRFLPLPGTVGDCKQVQRIARHAGARKRSAVYVGIVVGGVKIGVCSLRQGRGHKQAQRKRKAGCPQKRRFHSVFPPSGPRVSAPFDRTFQMGVFFLNLKFMPPASS